MSSSADEPLFISGHEPPTDARRLPDWMKPMRSADEPPSDPRPHDFIHSARRIDPLFDSDRHALYCGWVAGIAMKHGFDMRIVTDDEGNYTDHFVINLRPYATVTVIVPPPPDDWEPSDE